VLLALIILAPYWNILLLGQSLVPSANRHPFDRPFRNLKMGELTDFSVFNWYDLGGTWWMWEPAARWFSQSFRAGSIPLWDPHIAGGIDAHTTITNSQYFPPYALLLLLGDTPLQRDLYCLLLLALAGACCYRLARRWDLHPIPALVFAACFLWSGAVTVNVNSLLGQSTAMLPLMLLVVDWMAGRPNAFRIGASALVLATAALSSFLPIVIFGYVLTGLLALTHAVFGASGSLHRWRAAARQMGAFCAAALLSLAAIAFLLLPVQYASAQNPVFSDWYRQTGLQYISFDYLFTLVSPTLTYNTYGPPAGSLFPPPATVWSGGFFYVGLTPLLLLVFAGRGETPRQRVALVFCSLAATFFLLKLLGIPPAQWAGNLPVFRHLHFRPYACAALTLPLCGLGALAVQSLLRSRPSISRIAAGAAALLAFFVLLMGFVLTHPVNGTPDMAALLRMAMHNALEAARLGVLAVALLVVVILRRRVLPPTLAGWLVLAIIAMELVPLAFHTRFLRAGVWTNPPSYVRFLQSDQDRFRVHGVYGLALTANVAEGLGLSAISARAPFTSQRYDTLIRTYFKTEPLPYPLPSELLPSSRVILDLLNVKYLVTFAPSPDELRKLTQAGLESATTDDGFQVFRNPGVWPRALVPATFEVAPSPRAALTATGRLTGPQRVVLEQHPAMAAPFAAGSAAITAYQPDRVSIRTNSTTPALLVLLDNAAPGWSALVNGAPTRILTANYAFRAVEIPAGSATVEFRYRTPGLCAGLAISVLSVLICVLLMSPLGRRLVSTS